MNKNELEKLLALGETETKVFYLAGYIEQYGSGTVRMVEWMKEAGLPEPEYKEELGGFSVYFYKDIYTEENLRKMELNERQIKAVMYVKEKEKITNKEYQKLVNTTKKTASRDLVAGNRPHFYPYRRRVLSRKEGLLEGRMDKRHAK